MKTTSEIRLDNLNILVKEAGGVTELSKRTGYKQPSYLYQIINRTAVQNGKPKNIGAAMAKKLEQAMSKPSGWMDQSHIKTIEANSTYAGVLAPWDDKTPLNDDDVDVDVPFYEEIRLSAGNGFSDDIQDYNSNKLRFSRSTLRRHGIIPNQVVCVTADGNSMYPVIPDGATLGVNQGDTVIKDGKIYAINHGGLLRTKILKKRPDNKVVIQSYNKEEYPDEEVNREDITVIGRIFWWSVLN